MSTPLYRSTSIPVWYIVLTFSIKSLCFIYHHNSD
ncbi:unnamed protein product [Brassica oleracea var. botrytis]